MSDITWASRWDAYLRMPGGKVHWFSILNSLMVVIVMSCIVALIMMRTIRRDLARYEQLLVEGGGPGAAADAEESGWKMVSGDIFRAPSAPLNLCVQVGSGVQILGSSSITLLFAALGFLSPASRGSLLTALLLMYLLLAVAAGYSAVWLWGMVNRSYEGWHRVCWRVACFFPGVTVGVLTALNMALWATGSSGAIPLGFFFSILFLWCAGRIQAAVVAEGHCRCGHRRQSHPAVLICAPSSPRSRAGLSSPSRWPTQAGWWRLGRIFGAIPCALTRSRAISRHHTGPRTRRCCSWQRACCPLAPSLWSFTLR